MSEKKLTPMQSFEQKIKDKLTKDIGDLIPDEALVNLIEKATESVFFEDQKIINGTGYSISTTYKDSVFKEIVKELLAERMDTAIRSWLNDNRDEMTTKLTSFIETSAQEQIQQALFGTISMHFESMKFGITNDLTNKLNGY